MCFNLLTKRSHLSHELRSRRLEGNLKHTHTHPDTYFTIILLCSIFLKEKKKTRKSPYYYWREGKNDEQFKKLVENKIAIQLLNSRSYSDNRRSFFIRKINQDEQIFRHSFVQIKSVFLQIFSVCFRPMPSIMTRSNMQINCNFPKFEIRKKKTFLREKLINKQKEKTNKKEIIG